MIFYSRKFVILGILRDAGQRRLCGARRRPSSRTTLWRALREGEECSQVRGGISQQGGGKRGRIIAGAEIPQDREPQLATHRHSNLLCNHGSGGFRRREMLLSGQSMEEAQQRLQSGRFQACSLQCQSLRLVQLVLCQSINQFINFQLQVTDSNQYYQYSR